MTRGRHAGFTLIEIIAAIVVAAIGAVAILAMLGHVERLVVATADIQTGAQLAQECAEHVLAFRRDTDPARGYANVPLLSNDTAFCDTPMPLGGFPGYQRFLDITDVGASNASCTALGANCKQAAVTVVTPVVTMAPVTLLLVEY